MNDLINELRGTVVAWESLRKISDLPQQVLLAGVIGDIMSMILRHERTKSVEPMVKCQCDYEGTSLVVCPSCGKDKKSGEHLVSINYKESIPLAVLGIKKELFVTFAWNNVQWFCHITDGKGDVVKITIGTTYSAAEAKAREYLNGLPDKEAK